MPGEQEPQNELEAVLLGGQSMRAWHDWLSEDSGLVPASRYGVNGAETAYWALACEAIYEDANGEPDSVAQSLDYYQSLAVNDSDDVLSLVRAYYYAIPEPLKPYLDYETENGLNMVQQAALWGLCSRYDVEYQETDYLVYPANSVMMPGWAEGWIGGFQHAAGTEHPTIFVGVSPEGEVHS